MPSETTEILEFKQYQKSDKAPLIIYAHLECIIEKTDGCKNIPENSSTTKVGKHIPSSFSMSIISSFRSIEKRDGVYNDCMKDFCESLREHQKSYKNAKICYISNEKYENKYFKNKKYCKVRDHSHYTKEYRGVGYSTWHM